MVNTIVGKWQTEITADLQLCKSAFLHKILGGFIYDNDSNASC